MSPHWWIGLQFFIGCAYFQGILGRDIPILDVRNSVFDSCCKHGLDYAEENVYSCSFIKNFDYGTMPGPSKISCKSRMESCCNERRSKICDEGIRSAKLEQNCKTRSGLFEYCCNACKNGIDRAKSGASCTQKPLEHFLIQNALYRCCSNEESSGMEPENSDYQNESYELNEEEFKVDSSEFAAPLELRSQNEELLVLCKADHDCEFGCEVIDGYDTCTCPPNYALALDGKSCCAAGDFFSTNTTTVCDKGYKLNDMERCEDVDECKLENNACSDGFKCVNTKGWFTCVPFNICRKGYHFNNDTQTCEDDDECNALTHDCRCDEHCVNTKGSFKCKAFCLTNNPSCPMSTPRSLREHTTTDKTTTTTSPCTNITQFDCMPSDECYFDDHCPFGSKCEMVQDIRVCREIQCSSGFKLIGDLCEDIDECLVNPCPRTTRCVNLRGSYKCEPIKCQSGYSLNDYGQCDDINECRTVTCHNAQCENTDGSYRCNCNRGFVKDKFDSNSCVDVNECDKDKPCEHHCINTQGSFKCTCRRGFSLSYDKTHCTDIDECRSSPCAVTDRCVNSVGSYKCVRKTCDAGYMLNNLGDCEDVNECVNTPNICVNGRCENSEGSFKCICDDGYEFEDELETICRDIDECEDKTHDCQHTCVNVIGSFVCECKDGHKLNSDNSTCSDVDECLEKPCNPGEDCINSVGSYRCLKKQPCSKGYTFDRDFNCVDINECQVLPNVCMHGTCYNTPGSYYCKCNQGLEMNEFGVCVDIDECSENKLSCSQLCENTFGSFRCHCWKGYLLNKDGRTCTDIDECQGNHNCDNNQDCINTAGKYICRNKCNPITVTFCAPPNITQPTTTTTTTPQSPCYTTTAPNNGCDFFNECFEDQDCDEGKICFPHRQGNKCKAVRCPEDYRWDRKIKQCVEIVYEPLDRTPECEVKGPDGTTTMSPCLSAKKTSSTTKRNGNVVCPRGFFRTKRSECHRKISRKSLKCGKGYVMSSSGTCEDRNECIDNPCFGECINTIGSFECRCPDGFKMIGDVCHDVDECANDPEICEDENSGCLNTIGSYKCLIQTCKEGYNLTHHGKLKDCRIGKPCGSKNKDAECQKPWIISDYYKAINANLTEKYPLLSLLSDEKFEARIEEFDAKSDDDVKLATVDDFHLETASNTFELVAINGLDGPQEVKIAILMKFQGENSYQKLTILNVFVSKYRFNAQNAVIAS